MHLQHVQKDLVLSVRIKNATVSWKCISIANLQRWHKGSHQLHQTEASDQRHPWLDTHLVPLVHGYKKKSAKTIPHTEVQTAEELVLFETQGAILVKLVSDFVFGKLRSPHFGKVGFDFGQSQGLMLVNSRLNWRNSRLNLSKVKVWFWQGQGWIWAKSRSDFGKFKAEFGRLSNSMLNLRNSRLNLVKSGLDLQRFVGWFIPYDD